MLPALPTPTSAASVQAACGPQSSPPGPWAPGGGSSGWAWWLPPGLAAIARRLRDAFAARRSRPLPGLLVALLLVVVLAGCGSVAHPPRRVVLDALALQIRLTQDQVAQALRLPPAGLPEVSRVRVEEQQPLAIGEARGLRLTGRFDWRLAEDPIRVDSPFELYLQRGERGQSWRLARPLARDQGDGQEWITEPLPLPGERGARRAA